MWWGRAQIRRRAASRCAGFGIRTGKVVHAIHQLSGCGLYSPYVLISPSWPAGARPPTSLEWAGVSAPVKGGPSHPPERVSLDGGIGPSRKCCTIFYTAHRWNYMRLTLPEKSWMTTSARKRTAREWSSNQPSIATIVQKCTPRGHNTSHVHCCILACDPAPTGGTDGAGHPQPSNQQRMPTQLGYDVSRVR